MTSVELAAAGAVVRRRDAVAWERGRGYAAAISDYNVNEN